MDCLEPGAEQRPFSYPSTHDDSGFCCRGILGLDTRGIESLLAVNETIIITLMLNYVAVTGWIT